MDTMMDMPATTVSLDVKQKPYYCTNCLVVMAYDKMHLDDTAQTVVKRGHRKRKALKDTDLRRYLLLKNILMVDDEEKASNPQQPMRSSRSCQRPACGARSCPLWRRFCPTISRPVWMYLVGAFLWSWELFSGNSRLPWRLPWNWWNYRP